MFSSHANDDAGQETIPVFSNAAIADRLIGLAQLLAAQKENPFKVKAYRRAAKTIRTMSESVDELVRSDADLTAFPGIGKGISGALREIVLSGTLRRLDTLRSEAGPELAAISEYPRLDAARVLRIYKKLHISTIAALKEKLESGEIAAKLGARMAHHVRQAFLEGREMLLYDAENATAAILDFLTNKCKVRKAEPAGSFRRRVEVFTELSFLVESDDFAAVVSRLRRYGGKADVVSASDTNAMVRLASGIHMRIDNTQAGKWGLSLVLCTGSEAHIRELSKTGPGLKALLEPDRSFHTEPEVYEALGLAFIDPELREGEGEVQLAAAGRLPVLVTRNDIRGDLHAHSTSSDGSNTIEQMAAGAKARGYEYVGISDHSKSLKIARGLPEDALWAQIRNIDALNSRSDIRVLKSAEVDILADGTLDYPDELLRELDYTVCSIHSRFGLDRMQQTERIMRAMDNRYFTMLGHATGRLLLKRDGYELDMERVVEHARKNGCMFEINSSPDRLDLSAAHARLARKAGVMIAVNTDAHSVRELDLIRYGLDQARRAGLDARSVLNCYPWDEASKIVKR